MDCFAGSLPRVSERLAVMSALAQLWAVGEDRVEYYFCLHNPPLQSTPSVVHVGRAWVEVQETQVGYAAHAGSRIQAQVSGFRV